MEYGVAPRLAAVDFTSSACAGSVNLAANELSEVPRRTAMRQDHIESCRTSASHFEADSASVHHPIRFEQS
jgi:hypothetical protein